MRRFKARILVPVAVLVVTVVFAVFAKGQELEEVRYGDLKALAEGLKIDIAKLAGDDDRLGELEAYKLLEWMKQENRWQLAAGPAMTATPDRASGRRAACTVGTDRLRSGRWTLRRRTRA